MRTDLWRCRRGRSWVELAGRGGGGPGRSPRREASLGAVGCGTGRSSAAGSGARAGRQQRGSGGRGWRHREPARGENDASAPRSLSAGTAGHTRTCGRIPSCGTQGTCCQSKHEPVRWPPKCQGTWSPDVTGRVRKRFLNESKVKGNEELGREPGGKRPWRQPGEEASRPPRQAGEAPRPSAEGRGQARAGAPGHCAHHRPKSLLPPAHAVTGTDSP